MSTYYMSTTGVDTNNGTSPSTPVKTFTRLNQLMQSGDICYIAPGTYDYATYSRFSPANNAGFGIGTGAMQLIGDITGVNFGVAQGAVTFTGGSANNQFFNVSGTWTGGVLLKNLTFQNWYTTYGATETALGGIVSVSGTAKVQVDMQNCTVTNAGSNTSTYSPGAVAFMRLNTTDSYFIARDCTFNGGTSGNYSYFTFIPTVDFKSYGAEPYVPAQLHGCTITSDANNYTNTVIDFNFRSGSWVGTIDTNEVFYKFKNVKIYHNPQGTPPVQPYLRLSAYESGVEMEFEDCYLNVNIYDPAVNSTYCMNKWTFKRCHIVGNISQSVAGSVFIFEDCQVDLGASFSLVNNNFCKFKAIRTWFNGGANFPQMAIATGAWVCVSVTLDNCVISNIDQINGCTTAYTMQFNVTRTLFANIRNATYWSNNGQYGWVWDEAIILKMAVGTSYWVNTSANPGLITQSRYQGWATSGVASFVAPVQGANLTISDITVMDYALPDLVVPEMISPISGSISAEIPVAPFGKGTFKVLLDSTKSNTITLKVQKSWTGGKVEIWIDGTKQTGVVVADNTGVQTISFSYQPTYTRYADLTIFARDAEAGNTFNSAYNGNSVKVDEINVA